MKKGHVLIVATLFVSLIGGLIACSNDETALADNQSEADETVSTDDSSQSEGSTSYNNDKSDSGDNAPEGSSNKKATKQEKAGSTSTSTETNKKETTVEDNTVTKIEGKRAAFLEKLDNIQKELDALPEKKDSDKGVTNAMKNYYAISYEKYDEALNEMYALLREELSAEVMNELKTEQITWIEQKEERANEERKKYEGGTFENVAYYIAAYEATKERSYELVNEYMTD